jgi:DEAD/DEAH box helicase domain-containing protein
MSVDHVVVDVEIAHTIEETPGGWDATDKLGVAVACVWQYRDRRMRVYGPEDVTALQERLMNADRISGYNIWSFDFPVIFSVPKAEWTKEKIGLFHRTDDMLRRIWTALGFKLDCGWQAGMGGAKLDDIAFGTLGVGKIGDGAKAPDWFQAGEVQRVVNYCADDVALERDLCDFIDRYGFVIHNGKRLAIAPWKAG